MDAQEYLKLRLDDQFEWFEKKVAWNQAWYKRLRMIEIVAAALIPVLSTQHEKWSCLPWVVAGLGVIVAIAAGAMGLYRFHENWIQYRTTAEQLKHERFLFNTACGPYAGANALSALVERVETLLMKENATWAQAAVSKDQVASGNQPNATSAEPPSGSGSTEKGGPDAAAPSPDTNSPAQDAPTTTGAGENETPVKN